MTMDRFEYRDGLGRVVQTISLGEDGKTIGTSRTYDFLGRLSQVIGPYFGRVVPGFGGAVGYPLPTTGAYPILSYTYDHLGRPATVTRTDGTHGIVTVAAFSYDGLTTTITDADTRQKAVRKDHLGRIIQVTEFSDDGPLNTLYSYNAVNDLLQIQDHLKSLTTIGYDTLGRKYSMTDPDMGTWGYLYDGNGNMTQQTDARGRIINFGYDALNRITGKTYVPYQTPVTYTYDNPAVVNGKGRLYSVSNSSVIRRLLQYDSMGRVKQEEKSINGSQFYLTETGYDVSGKITSSTCNGFTTSYDYYPGSGLLHTLSGGSPSTQFADLSNYDPSGKIGIIDYGNGTKTTYSYDPQSAKLTGIETRGPSPNYEIYQSRGYGYTRAEDVSQINDYARAVTFTYTYDNLHRLLTETNDGSYPYNSYTYDEIGNILSRTTGTNTYTYDYSNPDPTHRHAVKTVTLNNTPYVFAYDSNGNMTSGYDFTDSGAIAARTAIYNTENMPTQITRGSVTTDFTYDGEGRRAGKFVQGGSNTWYIGKTLEIKDTDYIRYIFAGSLRIAKIVNANGTGATILYYHKDHLGSSSVMTDASGARVESTDHMPFGPVRTQTPTNLTNYRYTDQELDSETGLYYYGARYYEPSIGRWISPDALVPDLTNPQALNRYAYALNNPMRYVDPTGRSSSEFIGILNYYPVHQIVDYAVLTSMGYSLSYIQGMSHQHRLIDQNQSGLNLTSYHGNRYSDKQSLESAATKINESYVEFINKAILAKRTGDERGALINQTFAEHLLVDCDIDTHAGGQIWTGYLSANGLRHVAGERGVPSDNQMRSFGFLVQFTASLIEANEFVDTATVSIVDDQCFIRDSVWNNNVNGNVNNFDMPINVYFDISNGSGTWRDIILPEWWPQE